MLSKDEILHHNFHTKQELHSVNYLPEKAAVRILVTSGASCPDAVVEGVIRRLVSFYKTEKDVDEITAEIVAEN